MTLWAASEWEKEDKGWDLECVESDTTSSIRGYLTEGSGADGASIAHKKRKSFMSNIRNLDLQFISIVLFVVSVSLVPTCLYQPPLGDIYVQKVPYLSWSTVSTVFVGFWGALLGTYRAHEHARPTGAGLGRV